MLHPIMLFCALPLLQDPAATAAAAPTPAQTAWEQAQKRLAAAAGLKLEASIRLVDPSIPPEEMEPVRMEMQLALARPGAGRASWTSIFGVGEEEETVRIEWIGTGEKVYAIHHEEQWVSAEGAEWKDAELGFFLPFLGPTWSSSSLTAEEISLLPASAEHPDWIGLKVVGPALFAEVEDEPLELQVWIGPEGTFRAATISVGGTASLQFEIREMELPEKIELKDYVMAIPEGYEVLEEESVEEEGGLDASLLPAGALAPDVSFIGMDDAEFTLASLRGKTVLLNFWFFH